MSYMYAMKYLPFPHSRFPQISLTYPHSNMMIFLHCFLLVFACLSVYPLSPTSSIHMYVGVGSCAVSWASIKHHSPKEKWFSFPQQLSVSKAPQWEVGYSFLSTLGLAWSHLDLWQISTATMSSWVRKPYCVRRQHFSMSPISSSTALPETWEDGYSFHFNIRWSPEKNLM